MADDKEVVQDLIDHYSDSLPIMVALEMPPQAIATALGVSLSVVVVALRVLGLPARLKAAPTSLGHTG